jgi:hypothetical protein
MGDEHTISGNYFHEIVVHASDAGVTCESLSVAEILPRWHFIALMPRMVL